MNKEKEPQATDPDIIDGLSADTLRGRQSVRATFKLPSQVINLLSLVANQLGLKQKSLFDQLVENRETLAQVARGAGNYQSVHVHRQQKTYVLSRNSLVALEHVAKVYGLPRDLLVEISIQRLLPVMSSEQDKQEKRKKILSDLQTYSNQGLILLEAMEQMLGEEDQVTRQVAMALTYLQQGSVQLQNQVELGRDIEGFSQQSGR